MLQLFHNFNIKKEINKRISSKLHRQSQLKKFSFNNFFDFPYNQKKYQFLRSRKFKNLSSNFYTNRQERKKKNMIGFSNRGKKTEESVLPTKVLGPSLP